MIDLASGKMRTMNTPSLALCIVAIALLSGCGGGGSSPSPAPAASTPMLSKPWPMDTGTDRVITQDYGAFRLLYDCTERTALRYEYPLGLDTGLLARPPNFTPDDQLPLDCAQQFITGTYASVVAGWDRGHMVSSNHMDNDATALHRANFMTNVVPQLASLNRGIWLEAENVAECYRDVAPLTVYGGVVYDDPANDFFLVSHGIRSPDWFWKAIVTTDPGTSAPKAIAWLIPNQEGLGPLDSYLVSLDELDAHVGAAMVNIPGVPTEMRAAKPATTWPLPANCSFASAAPVPF